MKGGLAVIAKFKAFTTQDDDNACEHPLPSWVIDWRLAARIFRRDIWNFDNDERRTLKNAWAQPWGRKLILKPPPASQEQLYQDNRDRTVPYTKLILRGMVDPRFRAEGKCIWEKRRWLTDKAVWQLECDVYPTDLVVYMLGFIGVGYQGLSLVEGEDNVGDSSRSYHIRRLRLLRPAGDDEFKLIASLSFVSGEIPSFYSHWEWNPGYFREAPSQAQPVDHCRRFATEPMISAYGYHQSFFTEGSTEVRKFTII